MGAGDDLSSILDDQAPLWLLPEIALDDLSRPEWIFHFATELGRGDIGPSLLADVPDLFQVF
jgi:hypothetical protein